MNDVQDWGNLLTCCVAAKLDVQSLPVRGLPQSLLRQHGQRFRDLCGNLRQEWQNILASYPPLSVFENPLAQILDPQLKAKLDASIQPLMHEFWQQAQDAVLSDLSRAERRQHAKQHKSNKAHKANKIAAEPWLYNILLLFYATPPLSNRLFSVAVMDPDQSAQGGGQHQLLLPHRIILQFLNIAEDAPSSQHLSVEDGFLALQWLSEHTALCSYQPFNTQITRLALDWPYAVVAYQGVIEALRRWESLDEKAGETLLLTLWALQVLTLWTFAVDDAAHMAHFLALCRVPEHASLLSAWTSSSKLLPHVQTPDAWRICPPETSEAQEQSLQMDPHLLASPLELLARFFLSARGHLKASFAQSEQPPCAIADYFRVHPAHVCLNMPTWESTPNLVLDLMIERFLQQCVLHLQRQMQDFAQHFFLRSVKSHCQSQLQSLQKLTQDQAKQADLSEILTHLNCVVGAHFADQDWADWQSLDGEWTKTLQQCQQLLEQENSQALQRQILIGITKQLTALAKQAWDVLCDDEKQATLRADVLALLTVALSKNLPAEALNTLQTWQTTLPEVLKMGDFETMLLSLKQAQQALDAPQDAKLWQAQMANLRAAIDLAAELAAAPKSDVLPPETLPETLPDVDVSPETPAETPAAPDLSAENQRLRNKIKELDNKNHALATQKFSDLYQSEEGKWQQWADDMLRLLDKQQGTRPEQILSAAAACFVDVLEVLPSAFDAAAQYRRAEYSAKELLLAIYKLCRVYLPLYLQGGDNSARHTFGQNYSAKESDLVRNSERMRKQREFSHQGKKTLFIQHLRINAYLRLYFKVDQNKIIIAYVGEHLDCGQTN